MQRPGFMFPLLLAFLLAVCTSGAVRQHDYRMPTDVPDATTLTQIAEVEGSALKPPKDCPVTHLQEPPFIPPAPYTDLGWDGYFWYGSNSLWVSLPQNGAWSDLPRTSSGYTQKIPWWRAGYVWNEEPEPDVFVTGERLDAKASPLNASKASNAYASDMGSAMMMGVDFPTLGCWRITGKYRDAELSFVVWVAP